MADERCGSGKWLLCCLLAAGSALAGEGISVDELSRRNVLKLGECVRLLLPEQQRFGNVEGDIACHCDTGVQPMNRQCNLHTLRAMGMPVHDQQIELPPGHEERGTISSLADDLHLLMVDVRTTPWRREVLTCRASVGITVYASGKQDRPTLGVERNTFLLCPPFDPANVVLPHVYDRQLKIVGQASRSMRIQSRLAEAALPADLGNTEGLTLGTILTADLYPTRAIVRELRERTGLPLYRMSDDVNIGRMVCCSDGVDAEGTYAVPAFAGGGTVSFTVSNGWLKSVTLAHARGRFHQPFERFESEEIKPQTLAALQPLLEGRPTDTYMVAYPEFSQETLFSGRPCPGLFGLCGVHEQRSLDIQLWYDASGHRSTDSAHTIGILGGPRVVHRDVKGVLVDGDLCGTDRITVPADECFAAPAKERIGRFWFVPLSAEDDTDSARHAFSMPSAVAFPRRSLAVARPGKGQGRGGMLTADRKHYSFQHCLGLVRERRQFAICAEPRVSGNLSTAELRDQIRASGADGFDKLGLFRAQEDLLLLARTDAAELVGTLRPRFNFLLGLPQDRVAYITLAEVDPLDAGQPAPALWESPHAWIDALIGKTDKLIIEQTPQSVVFEADELARVFGTRADSPDFQWLLSALDYGY